MYTLSEELFAEDIILNESIGNQVFERFDRHFSSNKVNLKEDRKVLVETFIALGYLNEDADVKELDKKDIKDENKVRSFAEKIKALFMKTINRVQAIIKAGSKLSKEDRERVGKDVRTLTRLVRMIKAGLMFSFVFLILKVLLLSAFASLSLTLGVLFAASSAIVGVAAFIAVFYDLYQLVMIIIRVIRSKKNGSESLKAIRAEADKIEKKANDMKAKVEKHKAKVKAEKEKSK